MRQSHPIFDKLYVTEIENVVATDEADAIVREFDPRLSLTDVQNILRNEGVSGRITLIPRTAEGDAVDHKRTITIMPSPGLSTSTSAFGVPIHAPVASSEASTSRDASIHVVGAMERTAANAARTARAESQLVVERLEVRHQGEIDRLTRLADDYKIQLERAQRDLADVPSKIEAAIRSERDRADLDARRFQTNLKDNHEDELRRLNRRVSEAETELEKYRKRYEDEISAKIRENAEMRGKLLAQADEIARLKADAEIERKKVEAEMEIARKTYDSPMAELSRAMDQLVKANNPEARALMARVIEREFIGDDEQAEQSPVEKYIEQMAPHIMRMIMEKRGKRQQQDQRVVRMEPPQRHSVPVLTQPTPGNDNQRASDGVPATDSPPPPEGNEVI